MSCGSEVGRTRKLTTDTEGAGRGVFESRSLNGPYKIAPATAFPCSINSGFAGVVIESESSCSAWSFRWGWLESMPPSNIPTLIVERVAVFGGGGAGKVGADRKFS